MSQTSESTHKPISLNLPAKVTGIVFWGMVLLGILAATYLLNKQERQLENIYQGYLHSVESKLEQFYNDNDGHINDHETMVKNMQSFYLSINQEYPIEAMTLEFFGKTYEFGEIHEGLYHSSGVINVRIGQGDATRAIAFNLYLTGLEQQIKQSRKQMLLVIGVFVFAFGMVLQQILQRVLSRPILDMVVSAQAFAKGSQSSRFNDQRNDEFGYLARFINEALDSILQQQRELESSRKALIKEKIHAETTLHSITDGVITTDAEDIILYLNPVAERLIGLSTVQTRGMVLSDVIHLIHEESGVSLACPTGVCLNSKQIEVLESHAALLHQDGSVIPIEATTAPMRNIEGEVIGAVMVCQDVSHERKLSRQLSYQASHDLLTGLYNRCMFEELLEASLINVEVEDRQHALCYMDLDQFKVVNDTCGHVAGDELLRQLSDVLRSCIRGGDVLARLGGDEFGLLLENCTIHKATEVANKLRESVKNFRFLWNDKTFEIGVSIGLVRVNRENMDFSTLLATADMACYAAKEMGRNRVHVYEPSDSILSERHGQMHWAGRISRALDEQRMVLFEQPVVGINSDALTNGEHCEILIRMKDREGAIISPGAFIPAAERYNLMPTIDRWVITQVFKHMAESEAPGVSKVVAINLSGMSLVDEGLLDFVLSTAEEHGVDLTHVCFEITETAAISNLLKATFFIKELRARGCRFSLDDFGSGLSSFTYLKNLPVDYLKIDGSFVVDMLNDPIDRTMVESIVQVGHVMGIKVIAEWVENEATLELLKSMGVDYAQGYHLGRPTEVQMAIG